MINTKKGENVPVCLTSVLEIPRREDWLLQKDYPLPQSQANDPFDFYTDTRPPKKSKNRRIVRKKKISNVSEDEETESEKFISPKMIDLDESDCSENAIISPQG